ncbi:hypothetical protein ACFP3Q_15690 [Nocardioides sp. GCM10027113]|uniref:hypothetical protein n=1 Tax=unclassified Nocardioides TaxID=2615069 RepID=UPI003614DDC3
MSPSPRAVASRRATIGAAAALVALTACEADGGTPGSPATPAGTAPGNPDADPDRTLVEDVVAEVTAALALVEAARGRGRTLSRRLAGLADTHRAHLDLLDAGTTPPPADDQSLRGGAEAVVRRVVERERVLQRRLTGRSVTAQSGQLAALLAAMVAAVAQQVALLEAQGGAS